MLLLNVLFLSLQFGTICAWKCLEFISCPPSHVLCVIDKEIRLPSQLFRFGFAKHIIGLKKEDTIHCSSAIHRYCETAPIPQPFRTCWRSHDSFPWNHEQPVMMRFNFLVRSQTEKKELTFGGHTRIIERTFWVWFQLRPFVCGLCMLQCAPTVQKKKKKTQ